MIVTIYTLAHPVTKEVRYVGRTKNLPSQRYAIHNYEAKKGNLSHKNNWIKSLHNQGLKPLMEVLEVVDTSWEESHRLEKYWIEQLKVWGLRLTNSQDMGPGHLGYTASGEASKKPVHQYSLNGKWMASYNSAMEAETITGVSRKDISGVCTGARRQTHGYMWSFAKHDSVSAYDPITRCGWYINKEGKKCRKQKDA